MLMHLILQAKQFLSVMGVQEEEGQGLVEYALIIVLIAVVLIVTLGLLGDGIGDVFTRITTALSSAGVSD